jgi:hypothetical protein
MNELYIKNLWCYFKTNAINYEDAYAEFEAACEKARIEIGGGCDGVLRDENGNDID